MAKITSVFFGDEQRKKLAELGAKPDTDIEILGIGKYGQKLIRINGKLYLI